MNLANILTLVRLALLPFIIILMFLPPVWAWAVWTTLVLYVIGALTDFADGWVARKYNQTSEFGRFMDPISDKIFVVTILLMLVAVDNVSGIFVLAVIVILMREFLVAGLREFLGPKGISLPVIKLAKWKTTFQMIAIALLIIGPINLYAHVAGLIALCAAAAITIITGWRYLQTAAPHLTE